MTGSKLSPIALTARDQTLEIFPQNGASRVAGVGQELLNVNTACFEAADPRIADCAGAIIEGVLAGLVEIRDGIIEASSRVLIESAMSRSGMSAISVAVTAAALSRVFQREPTITAQDFHAAIGGALKACEEMSGSDREVVVESLRLALSAFPNRSCGQTQLGSDAARKGRES